MASWTCSHCGRSQRRKIGGEPIFDQIRDAQCPECGASGGLVVERGSSSYGYEDAFARLEIRRGKPRSGTSA